MNAGAREHWQDVYQTRAEGQTSWYRARLDESLRLIAAHARDHAGPVLDVGGGRSTLVDDLQAAGYRELSVLDVSAEALQQSRQRLVAAQGEDAAAQVRWLESDILGADLPSSHYALWHDRAVFHFLVDDSEQATYVALAARSVRPGGIAIVASFAPDGPERCSGLPVRRYDAPTLAARFADAFTLLASSRELHAAPTGASQTFTYVVLRRVVPSTEPRAAHASQ